MQKKIIEKGFESIAEYIKKKHEEVLTRRSILPFYFNDKKASCALRKGIIKERGGVLERKRKPKICIPSKEKSN